MLSFRVCALATLSTLVAASCSSSSEDEPAATVLPPQTCPPCFEAGSADGHADPGGAKAAGQARAGRIKDASLIRQPADARQKIQVGDFLLINDRVAATIEDKGVSDGYARFGGELLAVDRVGDDGKPLGTSYYGETLTALSTEMIDPDSVSVLKDGSDGGEAIVRVRGTLKSIPFLGSLKSIFPKSYGFPAAMDFVLAPGSEKIALRLSLHNASDEDQAFAYDEMHGFFQSSRSQLFTPEWGYAEPKGEVDWVGFDAGTSSFAWRTPGRRLQFSAYISGYLYFSGTGLPLPKGATKTFDYVEVIPGGPGADGLREAVARADGKPLRAITGTLTDAAGKPVAGAFVHASVDGGGYFTRVTTDASGAFSLHAPASPMLLVPTKQGYPAHTGTLVGAADASTSLSFASHATLRVTIKEAGTGVAVPARVQVVPTTPPLEPVAARGEKSEANGRLWQEFAVSGQAELAVPPGEHRLLVSRGYEWELSDQTITLDAGETKDVAVQLVHSVDTTGVMCADFHIHSFYSADSSDPVVHKVKCAIADGLDIPVSSEHEWVVDFQPIVKDLGLTKWAFGVPSEELTTFTWGHFGVLPLRPKPDRLNHGAVDWIGKVPDQVFQDAHAQDDKPIVIVNHPSGGGFGAYFSAAKLSRATGKGDPELWSDRFEAIEVFNDSDFESNRKASVADWFALLEKGATVWAVGSSDSHAVRTSPVGYPRTCILFGHDDPEKLTPEAVRDGVAAGATTISGGLYVTVVGPGGAGPGQTATATDGSATFTVTVRAPSWIEATSLETIVNGQTVATDPLVAKPGAGPGKVYERQVKVTIDPARPRNWVLFHAKGAKDLAPLHPGRKPFAVSNPIFVK